MKSWPALLLMPFWPTFGQTVEIRDGNLYFNLPGETRQITTLGRDSEGALSPDRTKIVYLRKSNGPGNRIEDPEADGDTEIRLYDIGASTDKLLLRGPVSVSGRMCRGILGPKLSPNNKLVYFLLSDYSASSGAVMALDVDTSRVRFFNSGLQCLVVPRGKYKGSLIILQRRPKLAVGYYMWFYLFSAEGKEQGVIGQDPEDVYFFLDMYAPE